LAVLSAGVYSLLTMPRREDPKITIHTGLIVAKYPGATPEQVEKQVTEKIEERLFRFDEVRKGKTYSTSRAGLSIVTVELEDNVLRPNEFWSRLRHSMIELRLAGLPEGVMGPFVNDDFGDTVAMLLAVHGERYSTEQLYDYAQNIADSLRSLRAVAKIYTIREQKEEIHITSSMERIARYDLSPLQVALALRGRNGVASGGALKTPSAEVPLNPNGLFQTEDEIRQLMVMMSKTGQPVYLGDIATVKRGQGDARALFRYNGEKTVLISVEMLEGNNIATFGRELKQRLEEASRFLPPDLEVSVIADQPQVVVNRISSFIREFGIAIGSVILVTMLLLPFRVTLVASLAIPVTVAATFATLHAIGVELHQVSIAALIVVLGMVVDDAIVIADNYVELLDHGVASGEAAWRSATEMVVPVLAATATIIAAFLPMLMISGAVGEFIRALPIAVAVALTCSFLVAVLLTPWLCRFFLPHGLHEEGRPASRTSVLDFLQSHYNQTIVFAMRHKALTLTAGLLFFCGGLLLLRFAVPQRFFPTAERPQFLVNLWLPEGARLDATNAAALKVEASLRREPLVSGVAAFVGESAPRFYYNVDPEFPANNFAQLLVNTADTDQTPRLVEKLRRTLPVVAPEAMILVRELEQGTLMKAPVEVRITGDDLVTLKEIGAQVEEIVRKTPGTQYCFTDFRNDSYEVEVQVDEETSNRLGLSNASIAAQLSGGFSGLPVSTFWEGDRDVPVVLRLDEESRRSFEDVSDTYVVSSLTGARVPVRSVAKLAPEWRTSRILHRNGIRTLTVLAYPAGRALASGILAKASERIKGLSVPAGYRIEYGGEVEAQNETFRELKLVLGVSMTLIFLILLIQFRSPIEAGVVMISIPLAIPGAVLGLLVTGNPFSFTAFMGLISLSGVVVRNAIILIDYIEARRRAGVALEEAAQEAGERRLRPIFLTTAAAAVGVTPMILSGSSLWSPLASSIAVGLFVSMFGTLIVVPVLYVVVSGRRIPFRPFAAVLAALLLAPTTPGQTMTVDEAIERAMTRHPAARIAAMKAKESEAKRDAASALTKPQLSIASSIFYVSTLEKLYLPAGTFGAIPGVGGLPRSDLYLAQGANSLGMMSATAGQPLTQLVRIRAGVRAAGHEAAASAEEKRKAQLELAMRTREVFFAILILERRAEALEQRVEAAAATLQEARDAVAAGEALAVKEMEAEAQWLEKKQASLAVRIQLDNTRADFNDLTGLDEAARPQLAMPPLIAVEMPQAEVLKSQAMRANPEVAAAREMVERAREGLRAAKAEFIPDVSLFASYAYQAGFPLLPRNNGTVGAKMDWALFDGGKRSAHVAERKAQLAQAEENLRRLTARSSIELDKDLRKVEQFESLVEVADRAVAARREALRIGSDAVDVGVRTKATRLDLAALAAEAEVSSLEAKLALQLAYAEAAQAAGGLVQAGKIELQWAPPPVAEPHK